MMLVAALPRSRTAWMSKFLSQSKTHFHHDGFNGCHTLDEYKEKMLNCGDCSTGLTLIDINKEFPEAKIVIIKKNTKELNKCIEWCNKTYDINSEKYIHDMQEKLLAIKGLVIEQSAINKNLKKIWQYLLPEKWNDSYLNMVNLNIKADPYNTDIEAARGLYASVQ